MPSQLMLRNSRTNSRGSPTTSPTSRRRLPPNATNTPKMSNSGPSTKPESRNSLPGWLSPKVTSHETADNEVAALRERYGKVKAVSDEWVSKVDILVKEWTLLDNTVTELNTWVAKDKTSEGENQFSLEKMESTLGELKNIFKEKE